MMLLKEVSIVDQCHQVSKQCKSLKSVALALPEVVTCHKSTDPQIGQRGYQLYAGQPSALRDLRKGCLGGFIYKLESHKLERPENIRVTFVLKPYQIKTCL